MKEHKDSALHHSLHQHLNPYFQTTHMAIGASPAESPLGGPSALGSRRAMNPQGTGSAMGGALSPLAGTSSSGYAFDAPPYHAQQLSDRYPFSTEAHTSPAIRG